VNSGGSEDHGEHAALDRGETTTRRSGCFSLIWQCWREKETPQKVLALVLVLALALVLAMVLALARRRSRMYAAVW